MRHDNPRAVGAPEARRSELLACVDAEGGFEAAGAQSRAVMAPEVISRHPGAFQA